MDVFENPFYVLNATPRDRKTRIIELSEDLSLSGDQEVATTIRNALTNPRNRLAAEIAWFPGISPKRIETYIGQIKNGDDLSGDTHLAGLCRANLLAAGLKNFDKEDAFEFCTYVLKMADAIDEIDIEEVMLAINEDRQASGLPAVADLSAIEVEISSRIRYYQRTITSLLDTLPSREMVDSYEILITIGSSNGDFEAPRLVNDLIDAYELNVGGTLDEQAGQICTLIDSAESAADNQASEKTIRNRVLEIISAIEQWDFVAQPIQLNRKSKGLDHDVSNKIAFSARSLAIHLFNEHDYLEDAKLLSEALQKHFAEVLVFSEKIEEDIDALDEIHQSRVQRAEKSAKEDAEFAAEITYETTFGLIFKNKFRISPAGIEYDGSHMALEDIAWVRWGAVKNYVNGIPTGTTYQIAYSSSSSTREITPDSEAKYNAIVDKLWRGVCIRLLFEMMDIWRNGGVNKFAGVEVRDNGIVLTKSRFFKGDEQKFHTWFEVSKGTYNGSLTFAGKPDSKFAASISYKDTPNAHILDFALNKIWKGEAAKLSEIFKK